MPLIFRVPGLTDGGRESFALVEHVDIMATLLDAAGLNPVPLCPDPRSSASDAPWEVAQCTEGISFLSLAAGDLADSSVWKSAAFTTSSALGTSYKVIGYSMVTNTKLKLVAWVDFDYVLAYSTTDTRYSRRNWTMNNDLAGLALYNHSADPYEEVNLASLPRFSELAQELFAKLQAGWRAVIPDSADSSE